MSSRPEREFVEKENIKPLTTGIGSLVEKDRILGVDQIPTQADALRMATARSFLPGVTGWLGSRAGAVGGSFVGSFAGPGGTVAGGFVGSTAVGGIASSFTQWLQNKVVPVSGREVYAMGKYPKTTMTGGYLASAPFLRSSKLDEWSRDPLGRMKNTAGEFFGEGAGSLALHLSMGGKMKNFDWQGETIGAAIESVLQNEETKLGNLIAGKVGLGSTLPPPVTLTPRGQPIPTAQRNIVAEATGAQTVVPPVAAPGATTIPPAPTSTTIPTPPAATTIPPAPAGTIPPGAAATVPPAGTIPPATGTVPPTAGTVPPITTVPPAAQAGTIDTRNVPVDQEELLPVQPRPTDSPERQRMWDELYGETHNPSGRPVTFTEPRPEAWRDKKSDPAYKPEFDAPDRGTGNTPVPRRPRIIPESIAGYNLADFLDADTPEQAMRNLKDEVARNPKIAEYVKNNDVAIDQAIQAHIEWNKKYRATYRSDGTPEPTQVEKDLIEKYDPSRNQEYAADLKRRQDEWDMQNGKDFEKTGWPKDLRTSTAKFRESKTFGRKSFYKKMVGPAGKRQVAWLSQDKDMILPETVDGRRVYRVGLDGTASMTGDTVNVDNPAMITESLDEAVAFVENYRKQQAATQAERDAREEEARESDKNKQAQTEAKDTKDTKDTTKPTSGPVEVTNIDDLIKNGGGNAAISQGGQEVKFDKFAVSISDGEATVGYVEMADKTQTGKGIGKAAYIALGKALAARGITLKSSGSLLGPGNKLWLSLVRDGYAVRQGSGYSFVDKDSAQATQAQTAPQAQQKPDDNQAEVTPEQLAQIAKIFATVPEYKWASPVGDAYSKFRMEVMKALGAEGITKSNSGVTAYRDLVIDKFGIDRNQTISQIDKDIIAFLKKLFKGSSGSLDNDDSARGSAPGTSAKDKKDKTPPTGPKPGPATITKPLTEDEKTKLKELDLDQIRQDNEDAEDEDADVNEPFHSIFTDIAERNGYMNKAEMKAYLEGVFGAKEFADMDAAKALAKWTPAPKPIKWDGKKTPISGTSHSVATVPNSTPKQKKGYGGRERSAVVIFDKDGKAVLISRFNEWKNRYSGTSTIGPHLFDGGVAAREGFNGMVPKYKSFEDMVADIGKEEAVKVYDEFIKAQIAEMRKMAKDLKFNPKEDGSAVRVRFERFNENPLKLESGKGLNMDPLNEILGLTGKESDIDFAAAVEKRYGVTFADAGRGYGTGWNKGEKFRRHYEFSFNINVPGLPKQERGKSWMFDLDNHDWIQAVKYEALAKRIKDPSKEASDLRKKIPDLAWEGSARKKAEAKLEAMNEAYAKKVLEDMKVYSPEDSRYVKGSVIPDYFPGQTDMAFNEGEIEDLATIYKPDPIETIPDPNSSEKPPENARKNLAFIEKNDRELYTLLQEHSMLAKKIEAISESLQKGESDDIDADISKHAELTRKLLKAKLDIIIQTNKLEKEYEAERDKTVEQQNRAGKKFPVGEDSSISFDTASTKEANNIELDDSAEAKIEEIDKEMRGLMVERNNLDDDDPADKSKINDVEARIEDVKRRKDAISSIKKKTINASITSDDGTSKGSVQINIGEALPDYAREEDSVIEDGESSTRVKIDVDWKSVSQDELNDIVENVVIRMLSMRLNTDTRRHDNLTEAVLFSTEGLDENSVKMLKKAVGEIQSKETKYEKSTYSKAIKEGNAILFSLTDSTTGSMSDDGMTTEGAEYAGLDKEDGDWTREAIRNLVVDAESSLPMFDRRTVSIVDELVEDTDEQLDIGKLRIKQLVDDAIKSIGPESYKGLKEMVQAMKDFKSGKMFGDKGQAQAKPAKPTKPAATEAKPTTPAMDSVTAIAQEKPDDSASLKTARTKLRAVIAKLGADSQQAAAMAKNIAQAEKKQAGFNTAAQTNLKPYGTVAEPAAVTQARQVMSEELKKGRGKSLAYNKALATIDQYENEYDLFTGTVTEEGIQRVSTKALEAFLGEAQEAIDAAGGMSKAGDTLKAELGTTFKMAEKEMERRVREDERRDQYGDLLADIASVVKSSKGAIAIPTLPQALGSSFSETSQMFDKGLTTGANSILRQPMFGIDVARYKSDRDYKADVNSKAEAMIEKLAMSLSSMGWSQFDPSNVSSNELMAALVEAGMGKALVPKDGVSGAVWKGDVGNVPSMTNTDTDQLPKDLFKPSKKPKQLGATQSNELIDESDTFNLSGETVAPATTQTAKDEQTQDLAPETEEPAYVAQARAQLAKLEKSGKNLAQQQTLRDTIEKYEASKKQAQPEPEATQQADQAMSQELKDQFDGLVTDAESTMDDLESTAGGTSASDKEVNGKKGVIAMAREAIEKASLRDGSVSSQEASDMLRAASTRAVELLESHQEKASNIEDMGREDPFAEREDMIDQLQDLANQLDILADIIEEAAGAQAEQGGTTEKRSSNQIMDEINALREERRKETDAILENSKLGLRETEEALTAIAKKYDPQFKKLNADFKNATKNLPGGSLGIERSIALDNDKANTILKYKRKLDAGIITQEQYDQMEATLLGKKKDANNDGEQASQTTEVPQEGGKTTIKGKNIAMPLPDSITNQDKKDAVVVLVMTEIRNQIRNSQNGIGTSIYLGDLKKIKGAEAFVFEKIKAFLDKNPSASYLEVVANLYQVSLPNSTKSLKGKLADAQALNAILMDAYRTAVANLRLSQIANGISESEVVSGDITSSRSDAISGYHVMNEIGLFDSILRFFNTSNAPYAAGEVTADPRKGKPKNDADELLGNTAFGMMRRFNDTVNKLILTGKYTTTTSLLDAVVNDLEAQIKNGTNTKIENEVLTKIKAHINSKKSADPFSRYDRFADDNDKARELDTRVDRNAKNRKGDPDARKGFTGMISRALDELRLRGEITAKEAEGLTRIMNYIGSQFFSGEKMSIKNDSERGYYGMYDFGDKVLTIFRDAMRDGRFEYTAAHEIAHLLTKYLPDKDRADLINEWRSARKKYLKDNPGIAAILKDPYADFNSKHFSSLDVQKAESIQPGASKLFVQKEIPVGLSGKTKTVYVIAAHEGVYQIFNADEFFAENFVRVVMKRLNSDPAYTGNPNTWREKLASLWDMIKTGFRQMFGKDVTARILADFAKGRISPDMKGNYGLDALHQANRRNGIYPAKADRKIGIDAMARDQRMGDDALVVTEQSERQLKENLIKSADKSMTIKDAVHMVLRGVTGPKAELIRLLTAKIDKDYRVQFSSKKYGQLYSSTTKTTEGRDINADKVIGVHVEKGNYIRIFLPAIETKSSRLNASLADVVSYVLTHEVIHSYTTSVIDKNSKLRAQAQALVDEIKNELGLVMGEMHMEEKFYGLTSPGELMTECLIDPELRKIANSIQSKTKRLSEIEGNTLLDKIISVFQSALESVGIKVNKDSVLDRMSEIIAVEREKADAIAPRSKGQTFYMSSEMNQKAGNYTQTEDYSYSPDSPTADKMRLDASRRTKREQIAIKNEMERAKRYRDQGMEDVADDVERGAAEMQSQLDSYLEEQDKRIQGVMPMLEQAIPDLKAIDGNDSPSARETLLGIRDDVMPSIGPANRAPVRKTEEKSIGQIAWDVVSGRYFSGISTKAHQNADRHEYSETVKQVANMIHSRPGVNSNSTERDIPTAMMTSRIKFQNKFQEIVGPLRDMLAGFKDTAAGTAQEQREVVYRALHDMIRGEKPITKGKLGEVATKLKGLFKELRDYRIEAGENLGDVEDYFPAVYDSPRIAQDRGAFTRDAAEAYKITIQDLAKPDIHLRKMSKMDSKKLAKLLGVSKDEVEAGVTEKGVAISDLMQQKAVDQANAALAKELGISREEVEDGASESGVSIDQLILERAAGRANELFQTHLRGMGSEEFDSIFGSQTGSGQENSNLSRVFGAEAQKIMSKWQVADPFRVVTSYVTSSVKKAEVVRKFGAEGEIWKQYAERMEADGVPYEVISEMRELVRVASGYGVPIKNKAAQTYVDSITMMTAASAMGRGFLNNLVEPVTMGIRAGNPIAAARGLIETWARFIREVASLSPAIKAKLGETFWSEYGKEIGTIHSSIEDAWMATHSMDLDADRADPRFRWVTNRIYQANLMDASEVAKQQASHAVGYGFILGLAKLKQGKSWMNKLGMDTAQSTADQLNELGIPEDQHADFAKFVMSLEKMNDVDKMKAMTENSEMAKMHQEAMVRFSYQSSVRSNRAHKPVFQDDLFGKTVLQLMNFSYSFAAEVNSRLFSMTKQAFSFSPEGKNYAIGDRLRMAAPVMSGFLAIVAYKMLFSLKDELYPTEGTERRKKDPEFLKWVNATSYAGFLGPKAEQLIKIIKRDQAPGGPVGQSLVNVARAATTGIESAVQGKDMGTAKRQAAKAAVPVIKGTLNAGASAINPILGAFTTQATNTTGWANELTEEDKPKKGIGDALFAKPIKPKKLEK